MKESAGGANVSVAANGTATADSQYDGTSSPDKAADGNSSTHWESGGSFPHWWAFAFSSPRLITEISLSNATAWPNEAPRTTLVQHSADGVTWLTAWMIDDPNLPWANPETRTYTYADDTAAITGTGASTLDDATSAGTGTAMGRTEAKPTGTLTAIKSGQYSSLAVLYAFNELTGTVANLATPADSLVITGGTRSADSVGRYFDPGDGIGDNALSSLTVGDLGISAAGPWSFFCRLAPPGFSDGTDRTIMSIGNGNSGGVEFNVYGTIYEWFSGDWRSGIDRPATEIQTFVVTYDGSVVRVYANGTAGAATTLTFGFPTGSKIAIGIDQRAAFNYFNDRIYEAGFVTACWTLAEVKAYDASPLAMVSSAAAITGTGAGTLDDATSGAAGTHTITGTASSSLDELAGAATGTFTPAAITGTASPTLEDLAGAAIGTHTITGTASPTLEDLASAGAGAQTATGTASTSLDDLTSAAIGGFTPAAITGTAASTLEDLASAGTDNEGVFGTASSTLDELTGAGWETTVAGGAEHSLAALTSQATGGTFLAGAGGAILFLADLTSEAAGGHTIGAGAGILAALDGAASGFIEVSGTASSILGDAGSHGFGTAYMARRVRSVTMTGSLKAPKVLNGTMRI
jgi:hypothetical protein